MDVRGAMRSWRKTRVATVFVLLFALYLIFAIFNEALADEQEVIEIRLVEEPVVEVVNELPVEIEEYEIDSKDVEKLARLLWSSPLYHESYKKELLWVVFNRMTQANEFGSTVDEVVTKREFTFFDSHAHRSEENKRIVRETWNEYMSYRNGHYIGRHPSVFALYLRFDGPNNREISTSYTKGGDKLDWSAR